MMRNRVSGIVLSLLCVALLGGCVSEPSPTEGLLGRDVFKEVLLQAQLLEAEAGFDQVYDPAESLGVQQRYDSLFARNDVSREAFETTFRHYAQRPEEFKAINEEILAELARRKDAGR